MNDSNDGMSTAATSLIHVEYSDIHIDTDSMAYRHLDGWLKHRLAELVERHQGVSANPRKRFHE